MSPGKIAKLKLLPGPLVFCSCANQVLVQQGNDRQRNCEEPDISGLAYPPLCPLVLPLPPETLPLAMQPISTLIMVRLSSVFFGMPACG